MVQKIVKKLRLTEVNNSRLSFGSVERISKLFEWGQISSDYETYLTYVTPVLNDEQLSHRINSSTVRQYCVVVLYGIRFVVSATYKTETNRTRISGLAWTNNSSKTDLIESSF